jgi:hypothetical protein
MGDSVIKLRPLDPAEVGGSVRRLSGFGVEVDAIPGGFVCSGGLKCDAESGAIRQVLLGERPLRKLYTREQRVLYNEHAPAGLELDDLAMLGPISVLKLKWRPRDYARKMVAEMWLYPQGARIFERLVQPAHWPRLGWDRERNSPDVRQERGAVLLAVSGVQSLSDCSCTFGIHRSPIVGEPPWRGQRAHMRHVRWRAPPGRADAPTCGAGTPVIDVYATLVLARVAGIICPTLTSWRETTWSSRRITRSWTSSARWCSFSAGSRGSGCWS